MRNFDLAQRRSVVLVNAHKKSGQFARSSFYLMFFLETNNCFNYITVEFSTVAIISA
jgi:hypothetical protein